METGNDKKVEIAHVVEQPYKAKEFELYVLWKVLPHYFKKPPMRKIQGTRNEYEEQTVDDFLDSLGIDDDLIRELSQVKNQTEFAVKYGLVNNTLTEWNKAIESRNLLEDVRKWALRLSKNVVMAMYNNALSGKNLNADRDRLNFLKFSGYIEKTGIEHSASETLTDILRRSLNAPKKTAPQLNGSGTAS